MGALVILARLVDAKKIVPVYLVSRAHSLSRKRRAGLASPLVGRFTSFFVHLLLLLWAIANCTTDTTAAYFYA